MLELVKESTRIYFLFRNPTPENKIDPSQASNKPL
tara:strand:- start:474 stop:578 length:105 start_codon:yes stop_codon:yes gene_type:complete